METGQLSPDGTQYWDGQQWMSALSGDGRWRWNGTRWEPIQSVQGHSLAPMPVAYAPVVVARAAPTNSSAVASLIFGIGSWLVCPLIGAIVAVIFGHIARGQIPRSGEGGSGMAMAGLILGYAQIAIGAVVLAFWILAAIGVGILGGVSNH